MITPIVGILTNRIDNRYMIATGFVLFAWAGYWMSGLTLDISQWSELAPTILSGAAAGLVFVPLSTTAMATLRNDEIGNASGLYNLFRNVGGSVGISMMNTVVSRHSQEHRADLTRYYTPSGAFDEAMKKLQSLMSAYSGHRLADIQSVRCFSACSINNRQFYSYVDDLRYLAILSLLCAPIAFSGSPRRAKQARHPALTKRTGCADHAECRFSARTFAPCLPNAVRVFFGRWAIVRFFLRQLQPS